MMEKLVDLLDPRDLLDLHRVSDWWFGLDRCVFTDWARLCTAEHVCLMVSEKQEGQLLTSGFRGWSIVLVLIKLLTCASSSVSSALMSPVGRKHFNSVVSSGLDLDSVLLVLSGFSISWRSSCCQMGAVFEIQIPSLKISGTVPCGNRNAWLAHL